MEQTITENTRYFINECENPYQLNIIYQSFHRDSNTELPMWPQPPDLSLL